MPINMRKEEHFVVVGLLMWAVTCHGQADDAATSPLWLRYPAISPSADHIAFSYGGDLYRVPSSGGTATHLTQHAAHDYRPVWSPDGKHIGFGSDRYGNFDVCSTVEIVGETHDTYFLRNVSCTTMAYC